jgi:putative hydrolase of the HAD superfamily
MADSQTSSLKHKIDWAAVHAILFDLGNVLLDLDNRFYGQGWPDGINASDHESFEQWVASENLWLKFETGQISSAAFLTELTRRLGLSPKRVIDYWNKILIGIQPRRFELLEKLQQRYDLYVLSNTNAIHIDWVRQHVQDLEIPDFEQRFFKQVFYSYELGCVKPDAEIYQKTQASIGLSPEHLLFIDDKPENVEAARAEGWQAVHLPPDQDVEKVFKPILSIETL